MSYQSDQKGIENQLTTRTVRGNVENPSIAFAKSKSFENQRILHRLLANNHPNTQRSRKRDLEVNIPEKKTFRQLEKNLIIKGMQEGVSEDMSHQVSNLDNLDSEEAVEKRIKEIIKSFKLSEKEYMKLRYEWATNTKNKPVTALQDFDPSHRVDTYRDKQEFERRKRVLEEAVRGYCLEPRHQDTNYEPFVSYQTQQIQNILRNELKKSGKMGRIGDRQLEIDPGHGAYQGEYIQNCMSNEMSSNYEQQYLYLDQLQHLGYNSAKSRQEIPNKFQEYRTLMPTLHESQSLSQEKSQENKATLQSSSEKKHKQLQNMKLGKNQVLKKLIQDLDDSNDGEKSNSIQQNPQLKGVFHDMPTNQDSSIHQVQSPEEQNLGECIKKSLKFKSSHQIRLKDQNYKKDRKEFQGNDSSNIINLELPDSRKPSISNPPASLNQNHIRSYIQQPYKHLSKCHSYEKLSLKKQQENALDQSKLNAESNENNLARKSGLNESTGLENLQVSHLLGEASGGTGVQGASPQGQLPQQPKSLDKLPVKFERSQVNETYLKRENMIQDSLALEQIPYDAPSVQASVILMTKRRDERGAEMAQGADKEIVSSQVYNQNYLTKNTAKNNQTSLDKNFYMYRNNYPKRLGFSQIRSHRQLPKNQVQKSYNNTLRSSQNTLIGSHDTSPTNRTFIAREPDARARHATSTKSWRKVANGGRDVPNVALHTAGDGFMAADLDIAGQMTQGIEVGREQSQNIEDVVFQKLLTQRIRQALPPKNIMFDRNRQIPRRVGSKMTFSVGRQKKMYKQSNKGPVVNQRQRIDGFLKNKEDQKAMSSHPQDIIHDKTMHIEGPSLDSEGDQKNLMQSQRNKTVYNTTLNIQENDHSFAKVAGRSGQQVTQINFSDLAALNEMKHCQEYLLQTPYVSKSRSTSINYSPNNKLQLKSGIQSTKTLKKQKNECSLQRKNEDRNQELVVVVEGSIDNECLNLKPCSIVKYPAEISKSQDHQTITELCLNEEAQNKEASENYKTLIYQNLNDKLHEEINQYDNYDLKFTFDQGQRRVVTGPRDRKGRDKSEELKMQSKQISFDKNSRSNDCNKISTQHKNNSNSLSVESAEGEEDEKNIDVDGCAYSIFQKKKQSADKLKSTKQNSSIYISGTVTSNHLTPLRKSLHTAKANKLADFPLIINHQQSVEKSSTGGLQNYQLIKTEGEDSQTKFNMCYQDLQNKYVQNEEGDVDCEQEKDLLRGQKGSRSQGHRVVSLKSKTRNFQLKFVDGVLSKRKTTKESSVVPKDQYLLSSSHNIYNPQNCNNPKKAPIYQPLSLSTARHASSTKHLGIGYQRRPPLKSAQQKGFNNLKKYQGQLKQSSIKISGISYRKLAPFCRNFGTQESETDDPTQIPLTLTILSHRQLEKGETNKHHYQCEYIREKTEMRDQFQKRQSKSTEKICDTHDDMTDQWLLQTHEEHLMFGTRKSCDKLQFYQGQKNLKQLVSEGVKDIQGGQGCMDEEMRTIERVTDPNFIGGATLPNLDLLDIQPDPTLDHPLPLDQHHLLTPTNHLIRPQPPEINPQHHYQTTTAYPHSLKLSKMINNYQYALRTDENNR